MFYQSLTYQKKDYVMVINLLSSGNDPAKLARLSNELSDLCSEIPRDEGTRAVVLTGAGGEIFFYGNRFNWRGLGRQRRG